MDKEGETYHPRFLIYDIIRFQVSYKMKFSSSIISNLSMFSLMLN